MIWKLQSHHHRTRSMKISSSFARQTLVKASKSPSKLPNLTITMISIGDRRKVTSQEQYKTENLPIRPDTIKIKWTCIHPSSRPQPMDTPTQSITRIRNSLWIRIKIKTAINFFLKNFSTIWAWSINCEEYAQFSERIETVKKTFLISMTYFPVDELQHKYRLSFAFSEIA